MDFLGVMDSLGKSSKLIDVFADEETRDGDKRGAEPRSKRYIYIRIMHKRKRRTHVDCYYVV